MDGGGFKGQVTGGAISAPPKDTVPFKFFNARPSGIEP
jgi:hypothetical protein